MRLEVDQSRKVEQSGPTVLAFSNDGQGVILVPGKVKRQVLDRLRQQGRERRVAVHMVFAALVALLLRETIKHAQHVIVDDEYTGHRGMIKFQTLHYLRRLGVQVAPDVIRFGFVGKNSPAHHLALRVFRGKQAPDYRVTFEDLWSLMG